jgi:hypothetical protein
MVRGNMLGWRAVCGAGYASWIVLFVPACFHPSYDRPRCGPDDECPSGLTCSAQKICESSGSNSPDAAFPIGNFCLSNATVTACLAEVPTTSLTISATRMIDTDKAGDCTPGTVSSSAQYCILAGSSITIAGGQTLSAHGSRPLVLMSSGAITVTGTIDVAGHLLGVPQAVGPGVPLCGAGLAPTNVGGGYGGSFGSLGGSGGADFNNDPGGVPSGTIVPTTLRGGCDGEAGLDNGGRAGGGGGGLALLAVTTIQIDGVINASGGGGGGSTTNTRGGGGGGAGGMIVIDAPMITGASGAKIFANGGSGGEGSGGLNGNNGNDAPMDPNLPAVGGVGGSAGGDGGTGANKDGLGNNAAVGGGTGTSASGGGGGGGGVGVIKRYQGASLPGTVSPPPS